ncbi:hypothetical protein HPB50_002043 [Hyalomma asiaticum]|uniref:Uncharacterized protein n=1 Tax=Hyalomma asiaticum TaxID=266040 RepID=A0ACB7TB15_HYAAI|nr:hypothetical protein HPB50_002043 [Hyalomma asiaticum]
MMTDILLRALPTDIIVGYHRQMASIPTRSSEDRDSSSDNFVDDDLQVLLKYLRVEVESCERSGISESACTQQ